MSTPAPAVRLPPLRQLRARTPLQLLPRLTSTCTPRPSQTALAQRQTSDSSSRRIPPDAVLRSRLQPSTDTEQSLQRHAVPPGSAPVTPWIERVPSTPKREDHPSKPRTLTRLSMSH